MLRNVPSRIENSVAFSNETNKAKLIQKISDRYRYLVNDHVVCLLDNKHTFSKGKVTNSSFNNLPNPIPMITSPSKK